MYALAAILFLWMLPGFSMNQSTAVQKCSIPPVPLKVIVHAASGIAKEVSFSEKSVHESRLSPASLARYNGSAESTSREIKPPHNSKASKQSSPVSSRWKNRTSVPGIIIPQNGATFPDESGQVSSSRMVKHVSWSKDTNTNRMISVNGEMFHYQAMLESLGNVIDMTAKSKFLNKQRAEKQGVSVEQHLKDFLKKKAEENKEHYEAMGDFKKLLPANIELIVKTFLTHQSPKSFSSKATPRNRSRTSKPPIFGLAPEAPQVLPVSVDTKSEKEAKENNEERAGHSNGCCVIA